MSKKIHVIKDESLGGVEREYIEVERKAEVGDLVVVTKDLGESIKTYGKVLERYFDVDDFYINRISGDFIEDNYVWVASGDEYTTLEPSDIVHVEGTRYRLVERKADVGERVLVRMVADADEHNLGKVYEVIGIDSELVDTSGFYDDGSTLNLLKEDYYVLVPADSELAPQSTEDIIANLVRRVADLERRDESQRRHNGVLSQRIAELTHRLNGAHRDIETWAQEVEAMRYVYEELYSRLGHLEKDAEEIEAKVEMVIERTSVQATQSKSLTLDVDTLAKLIGGARG